ncbi:hypothetical protein T12_16128 [Trichinella patagoniensis]|uniref:Uncharacterized protein n=1 Tax=Trichinella patagoniensis TaxID=990121 RepID=A0A0V0Z8G2_9BILA|nr:hypothetical protein T12_16128 [Trichinella patagoniensis]
MKVCWKQEAPTSVTCISLSRLCVVARKVAASVSVKNNLMTLDSRTKATWQMVSATLVGVENPKRTPDEERLLGQKIIAAARAQEDASRSPPTSRSGEDNQGVRLSFRTVALVIAICVDLAASFTLRRRH